jgi:hypothetical protein
MCFDPDELKKLMHRVVVFGPAHFGKAPCRRMHGVSWLPYGISGVNSPFSGALTLRKKRCAIAKRSRVISRAMPMLVTYDGRKKFNPTPRTATFCGGKSRRFSSARIEKQ